MPPRRQVSPVPKTPLAAIARIATIAIACVASASLPALAAPVAGLAPAHRPATPVIKELPRTEAWREQALRGIDKPYPESVLKVLDHQGNWYTPLDHPGMAGPYDLRGMHSAATPQPR